MPNFKKRRLRIDGKTDDVDMKVKEIVAWNHVHLYV